MKRAATVKRIATALALGSLVLATQPAAADAYTSAIPFPGDGELIPLPARSTYADGHAGDRVTVTGSAIPFPGDGELISLPARSTYSDVHASDPATVTGSRTQPEDRTPTFPVYPHS